MIVEDEAYCSVTTVHLPAQAGKRIGQVFTMPKHRATPSSRSDRGRRFAATACPAATVLRLMPMRLPGAAGLRQVR
jgi:hypothetical protein